MIRHLAQKSSSFGALGSYAGVSSALSCFSSSSGIEPLYLWLKEHDTHTASSLGSLASCPLLIPVRPPKASSNHLVDSPETLLERVTSHYDNTDNFVGGMGESDPGVWFAAGSGTASGDALLAADMIQKTVELVKEQRHGVPFGIFTTGLVEPSIPVSELGLDCLQVSLHASTPKEYELATGLSKEIAPKAFGAVCGFIVDAVEQGVPVEVCVQQAFASSARDLAMSLGAQDVHVYP